MDIGLGSKYASGSLETGETHTQTPKSQNRSAMTTIKSKGHMPV